MTRSALPIWAILPVKSLEHAKQRLADVLDAHGRRQLMLYSVQDVLTALTLTSRLTGILMVSRDQDALALGRKFGVRRLAIDSDSGQSDAIERAIRILQSDGAVATLTVPGDTPLLRAEDINTICDTLGQAPTLTIVSNRDGSGSNCIAASRPGLIAYQFGRNSFARHISSARDAGIEPTILKLPRFELDIDTKSDIAALMKNNPRTATQKFLVASGIGLRCTAHRPGRPMRFGHMPEMVMVNR